MKEKTDRKQGEDEPESTVQYLAEEPPEQKPSRQQERDHSPDTYKTGYDAFGATRVGIGSAGGDVTKLIRHNEGRHRSDGNHSTREAARDKVRITESFCSALDIPAHQQRAAVAAMATMNLDRFGQQKRLEKVALASIKVIVEWDRSRRFPVEALSNLDEDDGPTRVLEDPRYRDMLDEHGVSNADLYSVSQLVKRELNKELFFSPKQPATTDTNPDSEEADEDN